MEAESLPIPVEHWFKDVKKVQTLRAFVEDKDIQTAFATLKNSAAPSHGSLSGDPQSNSTRLAYYAGYCDFCSDLHKLTVLKGDTPSNQPEEWNHIQPTPPT